MPRQEPAFVTIKVPFAVRKRGGRKLVLAPNGATVTPAAPHIDSTLVKAIARAFRWQKMLETGRYKAAVMLRSVTAACISVLYPSLDLVLLPPLQTALLLVLESCAALIYRTLS